MLCCVGLIGGMAVGQSLGGSWTYIAPAAGFGIVLALLAIPLPAPASEGARLYQDMAAQVLPAGGYQSRVALGDSIVKLTQAGVIDRKKLEALYAEGGGAPEELKMILDKASRQPILLTAKNARLYVNLLWPLGLSNRMAAKS